MTRVFIGPSSPGTGVATFNGRSGIVVATPGDYAVAQVTGAAPLASPALTGSPTAPTQSAGDSSTKLASTAFVQAALASLTVTQQAGTAYTLALADAGTIVEATAASAAAFTVPPHSSVAFALQAIIEIFQYGAGQVTVTAGAGVTLRSDSGRLRTAARYATIGLRQRAIDEWVLTGDLTF